MLKPHCRIRGMPLRYLLDIFARLAGDVGVASPFLAVAFLTRERAEGLPRSETHRTPRDLCTWTVICNRAVCARARLHVCACNQRYVPRRVAKSFDCRAKIHSGFSLFLLLPLSPALRYSLGETSIMRELRAEARRDVVIFKLLGVVFGANSQCLFDFKDSFYTKGRKNSRLEGRRETLSETEGASPDVYPLIEFDTGRSKATRRTRRVVRELGSNERQHEAA